MKDDRVYQDVDWFGMGSAMATVAICTCVNTY